MRRLSRVLLATLLALALLLVSLKAMTISNAIQAKAASQGGTQLYLPVVFGPVSPAGSYTCYEYEFGLIWTSEVITLNTDGSSVYAYAPPYVSIVTGTWNYTALRHEVTFTNFRWPTATYEVPNHLWASRYLTQAGFEIALSCNRQ
jgi:hypothetical protein